MLYQNQEVEIIKKRTLFGKNICQIKVLSTGEIIDVKESDLNSVSSLLSQSYISYLALAAKIKNEVAQQTVLAPYESSLLPLPHQILALEKVLRGAFVRYLLADEVGMGKTIEAGLIIKELKLRNLVKRILVIVTKTAMLQWKQELKQHFNEDFHIYDTDYINTLTKTFNLFEADNEFNFWKQHNQLIISIDALRPVETRAGWSKQKVEEYNKYRLKSVTEADFDLLIIDECHKVGGSTSQVARYQMADMLCASIPNVLLLSATPHRGKADHFRRILQLLDEDAFAGEGIPSLKDLVPYVIRTEKRQAVDYSGNTLFNKRFTERLVVSYNPYKHAKQNALYEKVTDYVINGFNLALRTKNTSYGFVMILFQRMISSSTQAILEAMEGRLKRLQEEKQQINNDALMAEMLESSSDYVANLEYDSGSLFFKVAETKAKYSSELDTLQALINKAKDCLNSETDAKVEILLDKMSVLKRKEDNPELKFLIFTEFTATQRMLKEFLTLRGYKCTSINGSMSFENRIKALKDFKETHQVLISTDAAGESLNMQFAHVVINYDLPWNPMIIEQRIGRVDRIGQPYEVLAINMFLDNSVDRRVYEVIEEKLNQILEQLGIDKTADVLDSTLDNKKINNLFLTSLLNPEKFNQASENWLSEIKEKLADYKSTEGVLPSIQKQEFEIEKTKELKNSPLPYWLENLTINYIQAKKGEVKANFYGYTFKFPEQEILEATFDAKNALENPGLVHLTLQHEKIIQILAEAVPYIPAQPLPVIYFKDIENIDGYWSLWQITAKNNFEKQTIILPFFVSQKDQVFSALAEEIWLKLYDNKTRLIIKKELDNTEAKEIFDYIQKKGEQYFERKYLDLENRILQNTDKIFQNKQKAFTFQEKQLNKIGIENIREARRRKLRLEKQNWLNYFEYEKQVIPNLECLMMFKVENE